MLWPSSAAYASPALNCDASTICTAVRLESGRSGIEASLHVAPSSRVTLISPLVVPTQITPRAAVDGERLSIVPPRGDPGFGVAVSGGGVTPFGYPRFGLIFFQCIPPSVLAIRYWKPAKSSCRFQGANTSGLSAFARSCEFGSVAGLTFEICSDGNETF